MKGDIITQISNEVEQELKEIKKKSKDRANKIFEVHKAELNRTLQEKISKEKTETLDMFEQRTNEVKRNVNLSVEQARNQIIEKLYEEVREKLIKEFNTSLLSFIEEKLKETSLTSKKIEIAVNEKDFVSFSRQLGYDSKNNQLQLLNEKYKNTTFTMKTNEFVPNGIILIGTDYDINFTVDSIIANLKRTTLTKVFKELFTDER